MLLELCSQEFRKLLAQRYPFILLAVLVGVQLLRTLMLSLQEPASTLDIVTAPQAWADGLGWGLRMLSFCVLVIGAMGFSQEFSLGTAKTMLLLPLPRSTWYAAKLISLTLLAWVLLILMAGLGAIAVAFTVGWSDVVREGVVQFSLGTTLMHMIQALGLTLLFLIPLCAASLLVGLYFNHSGPAVAVAVLLGMVLESVGGLFSLGAYSFLQHLHRPLAQITQLGQGLPFRWEPSLNPGLWVEGITLAVFVLWGWLRLRRMDILG